MIGILDVFYAISYDLCTEAHTYAELAEFIAPPSLHSSP